jgi:ABC-2 type transport system ATP-binding protein
MSIQIQGLCKRYGSFQALDHLDLTIQEGIFGLLGHNGAGKSTMMKILATLLGFDEGTVTVFGHDLRREPDEVRRILGYLPQHFNFFPNISVHQAMHYLADLKGIPHDGAAASSSWRGQAFPCLLGPGSAGDPAIRWAVRL